MLNIDLTDLARMDRRLRLIPNHSEKVLKRTTKDLSRDTRSEASKAIRRYYAIKAKALNRSGTRGRYLGVRDISYRSLSFVIRGLPFGLPLIDFGGARETKKGVTVSVERGKPRRLVRGAFIANGPTFGRQIWLRQIKRATGKRVGRLPIRRAFGPSVAALLEDRRIEQRVTAFAGTKAEEILNRRIDSVFRRL